MKTNNKFTKYCKPELGRLLETVRLDKAYCRGDGDYLYYKDEKENEIEVLDILGGYGSSLFGHNNKQIIQKAINNYKHQVPFNAQASNRIKAGELGEKLNDLLFTRTNKNFITTFTNSGTEAVEAAIKHAELYNRNQIENIIKKTERTINTIVKRRNKYDYQIFSTQNDILNHLTGVNQTNNIVDTLQAISKYNISVLDFIPSFIALKKSFHGKTSGSVNLTYNPLFRDPFQHIGINTIFISPTSTIPVKEIIEENTKRYFSIKLVNKNEIHLIEKKYVSISGIFIEPLQGEGGIHVVPKLFLEELRNIADLHDIPLIFDEIQCGMGRTGTFLFSEQLGIVADYYLLAKSLGGGITKLGALMIDTDKYLDEFSMIHSSTFAEDDHSASIGLKALEILEQNNYEMYHNCSNRGEQLKTGLEKIKEQFPSVIKEVRGIGLMLGIEFCKPNKTNSLVFNIIFNQNLLGYIISGYLLHEFRIRVAPTLSSETTIRIEPSSYILEKDCNVFLSAIKRLCEIIHKRNIYHLTKFIVGLETYGDYQQIKDYSYEPLNETFIPVHSTNNTKKVAFLGHFIHAKDCTRWDKRFAEFPVSSLELLVDKLYKIINPSVTKELVVTSQTGKKVILSFIGLFITSKILSQHLKNRDLKLLREKIDIALDLAKQNHCTSVGFGGYTSIITNNCKTPVSDRLSFTSGNSLTVAMGIAAIKQAAHNNNIDINNACFAAIGASGNIASVYCEIMAKDVKQIILIGKRGHEYKSIKVAGKILQNAYEEILNSFNNNEKKELRGIAKVISESKSVQNVLNKKNRDEMHGQILYHQLQEEFGKNVPIIVTSDFNSLKKANLILGASNSSQPVVFPEMLSDRRIIICDIAVPADVDKSVNGNCKNIEVIKGGIVNLSHSPEFTIPGLPLKNGNAFACMSETILMGLSDINYDFSIGNVRKEQVSEIYKIANIHGFKLGALKTENSY